MLPTAHVPAGVYTEDCLAWSKDCELAIAAGEEVYLLLPRHDAIEPWTHVRIRVNAFTFEEWPPKRQASFADMSIGEEQARVTITSLAWSSRGIGRHQRCVLAVLTSNLLLSLWAPGGDPTDAERWQRVLIVNDTRVRSMAWVPTDSLLAESQSPLRKRGKPVLAVADDHNGVSFLTVFSPSTSASLSWGSQIIGHEVIHPTGKRNTRPSLLRNELDAKHFINYITFKESDTAGRTLMIYRSSNVFYQATLTISNDPSRATLAATPHQPIAQDHHDVPPQAPPFMQVAIQKHMEDYGRSHQLPVDRVLLRTWGVAFLGDLAAVCVTSHPAEMIEYYAIVQSSATILFGLREEAGEGEVAFPWQSTKAVNNGEACQTILLTVLDRQILDELVLGTLDLKLLYAAICATVFLDMSDVQRLPCLEATEPILEFLETNSNASLQAEREAIAALKCRESTDSETLGLSLSQVADKSSAAGAQLLESCPICEDFPVGLRGAQESFSEAYCTNRHPFCTSPTPGPWINH